jgi:hypothetical protein
MPHATGPLLTDRDIAVLVDVYKHRYLSISQIARLHFPSRQTAYRRLRALEQLKLLVGFRAPVIPEHLYYLNRPGADLVAGILGLTLEQLAWSEATRAPKDYYFLSHFLQVTDFRITLTQGCTASGVELLGFIPEYLGTRTNGGGLAKHIKDFVCDIQRPETKLNHTPDAVFALSKNGSPALFLLEIDRGTEVVSNPDKGVLKACRFYVRYLMDRGYQRYAADFSCNQFKGFRALMVTTSEARLQNIRQAVTALPVQDKAKRFIWLATQAEVGQGLAATTWRSGDLTDSTRYRIG